MYARRTIGERQLGRAFAIASTTSPSSAPWRTLADRERAQELLLRRGREREQRAELRPCARGPEPAPRSAAIAASRRSTSTERQLRRLPPARAATVLASIA